MPIYEFFSPDTNRIYSFLARSLAAGQATPRCPDNPSARMERVLSQFAVGRAAEAASSETLESPDPRMEQMMVEMERQIESLGSSDPSSQQLAHLMRTMGDSTGEKMPGLMEQMIGRLEQGEAPESLEAELASAIGKMDDDPEALEVHHHIHALLGARKQPPRRDPKLYEMNDYVESPIVPSD